MWPPHRVWRPTKRHARSPAKIPQRVCPSRTSPASGAVISALAVRRGRRRMASPFNCAGIQGIHSRRLRRPNPNRPRRPNPNRPRRPNPNLPPQVSPTNKRKQHSFSILPRVPRVRRFVPNHTFLVARCLYCLNEMLILSVHSFFVRAFGTPTQNGLSKIMRTTTPHHTSPHYIESSPKPHTQAHQMTIYTNPIS